MSRRFEELGWAETPMGAISLRRRHDPVVDADVYEVKLDDDFLMSSLFTVAEIELARLGLSALAGTDLDVVVGGLGLGYTACAVLRDPRVRSLTVVETLGEVIDWHRLGLLPDAATLTADRQCAMVEGDFFALMRGDAALDELTGRRFHAILLDIDHSPAHVLHHSHAGLYTVEGLQQLATHLHPEGVFGLWSDDPPGPGFLAVIDEVFAASEAHLVRFPNPLTGAESSNTVYVACRDAPIRQRFPTQAPRSGH